MTPLELATEKALLAIAKIKAGEVMKEGGLLMYGEALLEGRNILKSNEQFGQWKHANKLCDDRCPKCRLVQLEPNAIYYLDAQAAMWAAEDLERYAAAEKQWPRVRTVRGLHTKWKNEQNAILGMARMQSKARHRPAHAAASASNAAKAGEPVAEPTPEPTASPTAGGRTKKPRAPRWNANPDISGGNPTYYDEPVEPTIDTLTPDEIKTAKECLEFCREFVKIAAKANGAMTKFVWNKEIWFTDVPLELTDAYADALMAAMELEKTIKTFKKAKARAHLKVVN